MFLDEKLLQLEREKEKKDNREQLLQEKKEEILKQEREQKSVVDFISEIKSGVVVIDGKEYQCEREFLLDGNVTTYIFSEDVVKIIQENNVATIFYNKLEIGANLTFFKVPAVIKNEKIFQEQLIGQYKKDKITYYPLETGSFMSGNRKIRYATGVTTSAVGGIFIINFYSVQKGETVIGNYTCRLIKRYSFEHLFLAMLHLMFVFEEEE